MKKIVTVMSTFNGARFVSDQIESLMIQTLPSALYIRDDGSTDHTLDIIHSCVKKYPGRISFCRDDYGHVGIQKSFMLLLRHVQLHSPEYVQFCDQDDVWLPQKTSRLLEAIRELESHNQAALVFSDAKVVNAGLKIINRSHFRMQGFPEPRLDLSSLLFYCPALGNTMLFNRALLERILSLPETSLMPDKWALMVAVLTGKASYLTEPLILYRQHSRNLIGACGGVQRKLLTMGHFEFIKKKYQRALSEAMMIEASFTSICGSQKLILMNFRKFLTGSWIRRICLAISFLSSPPHLKRKMGLLLSLCFVYRAENS